MDAVKRAVVSYHTREALVHLAVGYYEATSNTFVGCKLGEALRILQGLLTIDENQA